jgi:hypothetical protein
VTKIERMQLKLSNSLSQLFEALLSGPPARNCATASAHSWIVASDGFGENALNR